MPIFSHLSNQPGSRLGKPALIGKSVLGKFKIENNGEKNLKKKS